jgi:drug/metabolite transporter (DMT)-like permease
MAAHKTRSYIYLTVASLIWGIASVVIKLTLPAFQPLFFLEYRFFLSFLFALPFLLMRPRLHIKTFWDFLLMLIYGIFSTSGALLFLFEGLARTTVLTLSLVTILAPLCTLLGGHYIFHEHITHKQKFGIFIAFFGAFLTVLEPIFSAANGLGSLEGNLFLLGYLVFDTIAVLLLKHLLKRGYNASHLTHFSFAIGFFSLLPALFIVYPGLSLLRTLETTAIPFHLGVLYMALFSGTIAYILRGIGQKSISITQSSVFGYLVSVFSIPFAIFILHEQPTGLFILGSICIAIGIFVTELRR